MPLVEAGRKAPACSLPDQDGRTRRLKDYAGRPLILYFYPKDDTPSCTREACAVVRRWDRVNVDGHAADVLRAVDEL